MCNIIKLLLAVNVGHMTRKCYDCVVYVEGKYGYGYTVATHYTNVLYSCAFQVYFEILFTSALHRKGNGVQLNLGDIHAPNLL